MTQPCWVRAVFALVACLLFARPAGAQESIPRGDKVFERHRPRVEAAVNRALAQLAAAQHEDGTFDDAYGRSTGVVSLAGMAFLSAGHLPGDAEYGVNLDRCIAYVLASQHSNGLLDKGDSGHGLMYAHNIATLFLSECSGMVDPDLQERLDRVLGRATKLIIAAQAVPKNESHQGGWRYKPDSRDSDLSCSGWALMALRSAKLNGAPVPDEAIEQAVQYVYRNHDTKEGRFGYTDPWGHSETLTGCGLLCLELCGRHGGDSHYRAGDYILANRDRIVNNAHEAYANYYNAQAMFQLGGRWWEDYAEWMYSHYIPLQSADGSWSEGRNGGTYGTTMMVLSFTVPYRQLPIYQRDETVDEDS
ncbi:MAG: prenyltransferase [Verrucomicrobiae bacterium]|nr:prenyltransferase [Verrucomicrobiae bacterium]MCP5539363.1 prenyltransferase [Akkermansiaceae bacterium]